MEFYKYKVINNKNQIFKGKLIASSEKEVLEYLTSIGFAVVDVKKSTETFFTNLFKFLEKFSLKDKIFISRNISLILKSGANLTDSLRILVNSIKNRKIRDFFLLLMFNIEKGAPFYSTFELFKHSFSPVEVELIKIGETSGTLSKTFDKLAQDLEKEKNIRSEIISSLIYPMIILVAAFGVVILVTTVVLPKIAELVKEMRTELPMFSKIILNAGVWIGAHLKIVMASLLFLILIILFFFLTKYGRALLLKISLKLPILKNLIINMNLRSFCFLMKSLIDSGINVSQSLLLTSTVLNHPNLKIALENIYKGIQGGGNFSDLIQRERVFPEILAGLLSIGYETGNLSSVLGLMEEFYEDEVRYAIKNLLTLLEPILIIFVGIIVGLVAVSIIVPVYQQISTQLEQGTRGRGGF